MGCRTATTVEIRTRLGFSEHDPIIAKEQSVLTRIMKVFSNEKIILQHHVLHYEIDLYFPEYRLPVEIDEFNHVDRIGDNEREEEIKEYLKCKFISINPDDYNYDKFVELDRVRDCIDK